MTSQSSEVRLSRAPRVLTLVLTLLLSACSKGADDVGGAGSAHFDRALNGAWVDGVQSGMLYVYITELRFNNGAFEWTFDSDLQQRGEYDTANGVLTITIRNDYGSPQRTLLDYSRPYTITGDTLVWGAARFVRK